MLFSKLQAASSREIYTVACFKCGHVCIVAHILPSCSIFNLFFVVCIFRYIQSLTINVSFVRYKEVYAAAAEIIGLVLKNMTEVDNVWDFHQFDWITVILHLCLRRAQSNLVDMEKNIYFHKSMHRGSQQMYTLMIKPSSNVMCCLQYSYFSILNSLHLLHACQICFIFDSCLSTVKNFSILLQVCWRIWRKKTWMTSSLFAWTKCQSTSLHLWIGEFVILLYVWCFFPVTQVVS